MHHFYRPAIAALLVTSATVSHAAENFSACLQFFAHAKPPSLAQRPTDRALCYDAFAVLHSGESKTPVFVAEKLNSASVLDAHEKRTTRFFADARLRAAERAELDDYKDSGFDRGHMQFPSSSRITSPFDQRLSPGARLKIGDFYEHRIVH